MRGISPTLVSWLRRVDSPCRLIAEAIVTTHSDFRQKKSDWQRADSTAGFTLREDGGLELATAANTLIQNATSNGNWTNIDGRVSPFRVAKVTWAGADTNDMEIRQVTARLNPCVDGVPANKVVVYFELQLYVVDDFTTFAESMSFSNGAKLVPLGDPVRILAAGTAEATYPFSYVGRDALPQPKRWGSLSNTGIAIMYVEIRPLTADGSTAGNVAWRKDSGVASVTTAANILTGVELTESPTFPGIWLESALGETPRVTIQNNTTSAATITFTTNDLDLGALPTVYESLEFSGQGHVPGGTSIVYEVRVVTPDAWLPFTDGQTGGTSAAPFIGLSQTYEMRATLTPDASGVSPVLRMFGVRERTSQSFDNLCSVVGRQGAIDPVTCKGEITDITLTMIRDGVSDYKDAITDLLSQNHLGAIEWRIWVGHPDLPRKDWLHIDTYVTDDVRTNQRGAIEVPCSSPLARLRMALPPFSGDPDVTIPVTSITRPGGDTTALVTTTSPHGFTLALGGVVIIDAATQPEYNGTWPIYSIPSATTFTYILTGAPATPATGSPTLVVPSQAATLTYDQQSAKFITDDILDNILGLAGKYRGQGIDDDVTLYGKVVEDSDAKEELDAIAKNQGGGWGTSQGRIRYVDLYGPKSIVGIIPEEEILMGTISPGFAQRVPEYFVSYDWDHFGQRYRHEVKAFNEGALTNLGPAWQEPGVHDDGAARWVQSNRVTSLAYDGGTGLATLTTINPHGLVDGQLVSVTGALETVPPNITQYNGDHVATVTTSSAFTYPITDTPTSPATGFIECAIQAHVIANRIATTLGSGLCLASFATTYPHPEWEVRDAIAIQVDGIAARDPVANVAVKGRRWAIGVIVAVNDLIGRSFLLWIRSLSDIVTSLAGGDRVGDESEGTQCRVYNSTNIVANDPTPNWDVLLTFDSESTDVDDLHSTTTNTERITVKESGRYAITAHVHYTALGATGTASVFLVVSNGAHGANQYLSAGAPADDVFELNCILDLIAGDYVYLIAHEGSTPTFITIVGSATDTWLLLSRVG